MDYDALIVGAGISGLYAASLLKAEGCSVVLLEGRNRISGRQWTYRDPEIEYCDMGGAYVGKAQTKILSVMESLGLQTYKVYTGQKTDKSTVHFKYTRQQNGSGTPSFSNPLVVLDLNNIMRKMDTLSKQIPMENPWDAPNADYLDSISVQDFLDKNIWTRECMTLIRILSGGTSLLEPKYMSLLCFLHDIKLSGGLGSITAITDGLQEFKIQGGSASISEKLAEKVQDDIQLNKQVIGVSEIEGGVEVTTDDNTIYTAKKVIITVPLPSISDIKFSPPLPQYLQKLSSTKLNGQGIKTCMFYKTAFWRDHGLSGELMSEEGIVTLAMDDTKPDGSHAAIVGFITGEKTAHYATLSMDERKRMITQQYAEEYGVDTFLSPTNYVEKYWQDEEAQRYSKGCCLWSLPPGVITKIRRLSTPKQPCGNVYFAGTESALTFRSYMDGALRSAHCAAAQVCGALGKQMIYDEDEFSQEVPYKQMGTVEKYLPSVPGFIALCVVFAVVILIIAIAITLAVVL